MRFVEDIIDIRDCVGREERRGEGYTNEKAQKKMDTIKISLS